MAGDLGRRPSGLLRLSVPRAVVPVILQPMIASFCEAYPDIELEITAGEELIDIAAQGFDAGIRLGEFIAADMTVVRLTPAFRFVVVGSPGYIARAGAPERPEDLRGHACLRLRRTNGAFALWRFVEGNQPVEVSVAGPLVAHDFPTLLGAALEGVGLAQVPEPLAKAAVGEDKLKHLLAPFAPTTPGVFLYHSGRRDVLPKLRAFIDHVKRVPLLSENLLIP